MIEADFMREYHIDLSFSLNNLTWRRFQVLLDNLSVNSNVVNIIQQRKSGKAPMVSSKARGESIMNQYF